MVGCVARDGAIDSLDLLDTDHLETILGLCIDKLGALDLDGLNRRNGGQQSTKRCEKGRLHARKRAMISVIFVDLRFLDPSGNLQLTCFIMTVYLTPYSCIRRATSLSEFSLWFYLRKRNVVK